MPALFDVQRDNERITLVPTVSYHLLLKGSHGACRAPVLYPVGSWKRRAARSGHPASARDRHDNRAGAVHGGTRRGRGRYYRRSGTSSQIPQPLGTWVTGQDKPGPRAPLRDHQMRDGKVACLRLPVAMRRQTGATHRQVEKRRVGPVPAWMGARPSDRSLGNLRLCIAGLSEF